MTTVAEPQQAASSSSGASIWKAPQWVTTFYSQFPLVWLDQDEEVDWKKQSDADVAECSLWIHPPSSTSYPHHRSWASSNPSSLRAQLLFLLRDPAVRVTFRPWAHESAAPNGTLPALHILDDASLVSSEDIRSWIDTTYPLKGKGKELQGLPNQEAYDRALALAQLILGRLLPAYLISLPARPSNLHLHFPTPPPLAAGLSTPLPASLTGDTRNLDSQEIVQRGIEVLGALETVLSSSAWAMDATRPTPLDALVASHLYPIFSLDADKSLRRNLEERSVLGDYVDRVMIRAGAKLI